MFCFQSPFTRTSRMTAETTKSSGTSPSSPSLHSATSKQDTSIGGAMQSNNVSTSTTMVAGVQEVKRRGSEAISEGSGESSIKFIDQVSISGGSSTDTLPGIRADYLDTEPFSPGPETKSSELVETTSGSVSVPANNSLPINNLDRNSHMRTNGSSMGLTSMANIRVVDNDVRSTSPTTEQSICTPTKCSGNAMKNNGGGGAITGSGGGSRWRRKLLLRLRSSDSSNSSNGDPSSTSPSPSPVSMSDNSRSSSSSRHSNSTNLNNNYNNQHRQTRQLLDNHQDVTCNFVGDGGASTELTTLTTSRHREWPPTLIAQPEEDEDGDQVTCNPNNLVTKSPSIYTCSINDIPSLENGFSDPDDEEEEELDRCHYAETENEETSLPSSPGTLAAVKLANVPNPSMVKPYYGFLSVNGGAMRQETTSTSSPQLSTGAVGHSDETIPLVNDIGEPLGSGCTPKIGLNLNPDSLDAASCLPVARSCPNLEQQSAGCSSTSGSSSPSPSPGPAGPRFKPLEEGDIQVCYLNHTRTLVSKILSSKFLRRWETHHLYLNDAYLSSRTLTGFLQQPVLYSSMSEVYAVARWDPTYKYCLRIVLPDGSLLLQASNAYTRDQWYHSILWKKSIFKYQHLTRDINTREEIILRELKSMVDFALWTPLQDERVNGAPLEAVAKLLEDPIVVESNTKDDKRSIEIEELRGRGDRRSWAEAVLAVAAPLLEKAAPPSALARALARLTDRHPRSPLVIGLSPAITRCLKHTVDFGKSPDMRKLIQVFVAALYENNDGEQTIRDYIASVHGPGSDCPHPRILPNLVSVCVAAIFHRFEVMNRKSSKTDDTKFPPPLRCYLLVLKITSEYADWRPGLGALLQPVPFPERALVDKEVQESVMLSVMRRLAADPRCSVHRVLLPVRELNRGWIQLAAPSTNDACPDEGALFGEMLTTLLGCCCRRKRFIASLVKQTWGACILLGVRGCDAAQEALCLMLEWRLLPNEEHRLHVVSALQSTESGKNRYTSLCQRQKNLQDLQQKGGPKKLTLPARATDADVAVILGGGALGNLECLTLAFTSVTSACAEQLIKLPALRHLNLWATQFGDAGLQMISEHLQKLQVLNLCETPVSDKGISTLASLTSLRKLNLNSTKLSAQTFESLKKRLPALQEFDVRYTEAW